MRESSRIAFRNKKYFSTNWPSRATSAPAKTACCFKIDGLGPRFGSDVWYRALQFGQRKNGGAFGLGMSARSRPSEAGDHLKICVGSTLYRVHPYSERVSFRGTDQKTMVEKSTNDRTAI
jgi:hypothetical protein